MNIEREEGAPTNIISNKPPYSLTVMLHHYKQDFAGMFNNLFGKHIKYHDDSAYIKINGKTYAHRTYALGVFLKNDYYHAHAKCKELIQTFLARLAALHADTGKAPICIRWKPGFNWEKLGIDDQSENPGYDYMAIVKVRLSFIHPHDELKNTDIDN